MSEILEMLSIAFIVSSFVLLSYTLLKNFRGMQVPPYWIYFLLGFVLLAINNIYGNLVATPDLAAINQWIKLFSTLSLLLGSYEIFRAYESSVSGKIKQLSAATKNVKSAKRRARKKK